MAWFAVKCILRLKKKKCILMIKKDFGIKLPLQYAEIIRTLCFTLSNNQRDRGP